METKVTCSKKLAELADGTYGVEYASFKQQTNSKTNQKFMSVSLICVSPDGNKFWLNSQNESQALKLIGAMTAKINGAKCRIISIDVTSNGNYKNITPNLAELAPF